VIVDSVTTHYALYLALGLFDGSVEIHDFRQSSFKLSAVLVL